MDDVKILRLQNGDNVIGYITNLNDSIKVVDPMLVDVQFINNRTELFMQHWLPKVLVKHNEAIISCKDILFVTDPTDDFNEYYRNTVERVNELLTYKEKTKDMNEEQINIIMDAYEELNQGSTLH
jgi:hypothetical protein